MQDTGYKVNQRRRKSITVRGVREKEMESWDYRILIALPAPLPLTTGSSTSIASAVFLFLAFFRAGAFDDVPFVRCCFTLTGLSR